MDQELREINQTATSGDDSRNLETAIRIESDDLAGTKAKSNGSALNDAVIKNDAAKTEEGDKCSSCSIDVNCEDFVGENQRVCRICHLNPKESGESLIRIGCGCKGEVGVAHLHCAEAWFKVKGNRLCEICGETAKNITGVSDNGFLEEWSERSANADNTSDGTTRCLRGQPVCNLLMACLVIGFVLPWFFRVNMF